MFTLTGQERRALVFVCAVLLTGALLRGVGYRAGSLVPLESQVSPELLLEVDLNHATTEQLVLLPGIGPQLAGRILELREKTGGFSCPEDLLQVKGIGEVKLEKLRNLIVCR